MTGRDKKIIQIVCDQLCKVEKCEACPLESFLEKDKEEYPILYSMTNGDNFIGKEGETE